ncbi:hypothetical protein JCM16814_34060 [Desulfobaculum senezii]
MGKKRSGGEAPQDAAVEEQAVAALAEEENVPAQDAQPGDADATLESAEALLAESEAQAQKIIAAAQAQAHAIIEDAKGSAAEIEAEAEERALAPLSAPRPSAPAAPERTIPIIIAEDAGEDGKRDVTVTVNGKNWVIRRKHQVSVPEPVFNVLRDAVRTVWWTDEHNVTHSAEEPRFIVNRMDGA